MIDMTKTLKKTIQIPSRHNNNLPHCDWVELRAKVVKNAKMEKFLVFSFYTGQDSIYPGSNFYSEPVEEGLTNRDYEESMEVEITYTPHPKEGGPNGAYIGAEKVLEDSSGITHKWQLHPTGLHFGEIRLNGIPVEVIILPEIPEILGVDGREFM